MKTWKGTFTCWWKGEHIWKPTTLRLSLDGTFAVLAGFWWPHCTCSRCGAVREGVNEQYASEKGWLKDE